jgi:hypothetical protein
MRPRRRRIPGSQAGPSPEKRAPSRAPGLTEPSLLGLARPAHGPQGGGPRAKPQWRVVLAAAGGCAAVVVGAVVVSHLPHAGQRVTIRPAAPGGPAPGTIFVSNVGPYDNTTQRFTTAGSVTLYRPGSSGNARPEAVITKGMNYGPTDLAVDSSGDLWVANQTGGTVVEYSRAELVQPSPAPTVTIHVEGPGGVAFDPSGNLWASINFATAGNGAVEEFTKAELAKSGTPAPVFTLNEGDCRSGFDSSGDLWEGSTTNSLTEWTKPQLARTGSALPPPKVIVTSDALNGGCKPVFDRVGDLWVPNMTNLVEYTRQQLAKSGSVAPKVLISSPGLSNVVDAAFDPSGDLWAANYVRNGAVLEFTKADLAKSGAVAPARTISGPTTGLNYSFALAIEP